MPVVLLTVYTPRIVLPLIAGYCDSTAVIRLTNYLVVERVVVLSVKIIFCPNRLIVYTILELYITLFILL